MCGGESNLVERKGVDKDKKVMAYIAQDRNGDYWIYGKKPKRDDKRGIYRPSDLMDQKSILIPRNAAISIIQNYCKGKADWFNGEPQKIEEYFMN